MQERTDSFGYWLRRRRKALDLTQEALAERVSCSGFSIRKIEADERRPSRHLAERLATALAIPAEERRDFLDAARALSATRRLRLDALPLAAAAPAAAAAGSTPSSAAAASDAAPFVGRAAEFALLSGLVARLGAGSGFTVLLEGEPGIGKSRLLREIERHARALGLPTLATHCYEIERATPYQPVLDLVTRALDQVPDFALRTLAPVSLAELAALVPEITERAPGLPALSNDFPAVRQARLPRAVDQLFEAARGGRPLILMVDDIQWADDASAQVLLYLARHAAERPVGVVFTCRDEDAGQRRAPGPVGREPAPRRRRAPAAAGAAGRRPTPKPWWPTLAAVGARRRRPGRAPAPRNRGQPVLPDLDPAVARARARRSSMPARARPRRRPACCPTRCAPRCACAWRMCPRRCARCSRWPRCSAGASISTPCSR